MSYCIHCMLFKILASVEVCYKACSWNSVVAGGKWALVCKSPSFAVVKSPGRRAHSEVAPPKSVESDLPPDELVPPPDYLLDPRRESTATVVSEGGFSYQRLEDDHQGATDKLTSIQEKIPETKAERASVKSPELSKEEHQEEEDEGGEEEEEGSASQKEEEDDVFELQGDRKQLPGLVPSCLKRTGLPSSCMAFSGWIPLLISAVPLSHVLNTTDDVVVHYSDSSSHC